MSLERRETRGERTVVSVGLTGGIGAGKSTALTMFQDCGAQVASADDLVHALYARSEVASRVAGYFGPQVLDAASSVDRGRLAEAVRGRPERLHWLEGLTHPLVAEEIARRVATAAAGSLLVFEVPLLFEAGYQYLFDLIVTVEAGPEVRRQRSIQRFDLQQFAELEALQASPEQRIDGADLVITNDGAPELLRAGVEEACELARAMREPSAGGSEQ